MTPSAPARLHVVSGKGGTGKTTIAAALAWRWAASGRRVLLCEVEGRDAIGRLWGRELDAETVLDRPGGGELVGLSVDPREALAEYLATAARMGPARRLLERTGLFDFATSIAPGLRDVLLLGKVYEATRRALRGRPGAYDHVVLDAPATGRIAPFLHVGEAVAGLARVGPIHQQAASIAATLREHAVVHLVTTLAELPVTETLEAIDDLAPTGVRVASIVANQLSPTPLSAEAFDLVGAPGWRLDVPGLDARALATLRAEFADRVRALGAEQEHYDRLLETGRALAEVDRVPDGVTPATLPRLAAALDPVVAAAR